MDESTVLNATESVWNLLTSETVAFLMILQIGLLWVGAVDLAGIYHALRPRDATAWLLLGVLVVIVIAPSVDLEPTILRVTHLSGISLLLVAATMASLVFILPTILASCSRHPSYTISSANDLVVLVCARRC